MKVLRYISMIICLILAVFGLILFVLKAKQCNWCRLKSFKHADKQALILALVVFLISIVSVYLEPSSSSISEGKINILYSIGNICSTLCMSLQCNLVLLVSVKVTSPCGAGQGVVISAAYHLIPYSLCFHVILTRHIFYVRYCFIYRFPE